eukprot:5003636-Prymnesium_polylepis.1
MRPPSSLGHQSATNQPACRRAVAASRRTPARARSQQSTSAAPNAVRRRRCTASAATRWARQCSLASPTTLDICSKPNAATVDTKHPKAPVALLG